MLDKNRVVLSLNDYEVLKSKARDRAIYISIEKDKILLNYKESEPDIVKAKEWVSNINGTWPTSIDNDYVIDAYFEAKLNKEICRRTLKLKETYEKFWESEKKHVITTVKHKLYNVYNISLVVCLLVSIVLLIIKW